jgi:hypothetical protein
VTSTPLLVLLGNGTIREAKTIRDALPEYSTNTGMQVNLQKSTLTLHQIDDPTSVRIKALLPFLVKGFEENLKYLRFQLKANNNSYKDWL